MFFNSYPAIIRKDWWKRITLSSQSSIQSLACTTVVAAGAWDWIMFNLQIKEIVKLCLVFCFFDKTEQLVKIIRQNITFGEPKQTENCSRWTKCLNLFYCAILWTLETEDLFLKKVECFTFSLFFFYCQALRTFVLSFILVKYHAGSNKEELQRDIKIFAKNISFCIKSKEVGLRLAGTGHLYLQIGTS